ncbi:MAG TPA: SCO family protein [Candidatus Sulfomarinibacteraceae bacterium]|nr:SCO family protein [Candidatus Sulfomarinibacteraceae bacterium]
MKRIFLPLLTILGLALLVGGGVAACSTFTSTPEFNGTEYPEPRDTPAFTLTGAAGDDVSLSDFRDKVVLIYFGYTFCPDACPTTMADLARVQRQLGDGAEAVQVLMVSVDPQRDTPQAAQAYAESFDPSFIGLSGTEAQIAAAAEPFGVFYEAHDGGEGSGYLVDHTARVFLINRQGELHLTYPFGAPPEEIAADLRYLVRE